jgi:hypothetical protein
MRSQSATPDTTTPLQKPLNMCVHATIALPRAPAGVPIGLLQPPYSSWRPSRVFLDRYPACVRYVTDSGFGVGECSVTGQGQPTSATLGTLSFGIDTDDGGSKVGSNRGRDSRNAYLPTVARGVSWRLYELLAEVAAGSAITRPQTSQLVGRPPAAQPDRDSNREPLAGLPVFKSDHPHARATHSHANATNPDRIKNGPTLQSAGFG